MTAARRMSREGGTRPQTTQLRIDQLGANGDGLGRWLDGSPAFVPLALPGDLIEAAPTEARGDGWAGEMLRLIEPSSARRDKPCAAFGACGGCSVQQWDDDAYAGWKRGLLVGALRRAGFADAPVAELVRTSPHTRRRMDLALARTGKRVVAGLHRRSGQEIIDISPCQVLEPRLVMLAGELEDALPGLGILRREGSALVNMTDSGFDLLLRTDSEPDAMARRALAEFAGRAGVARISWAATAGAKSAPETLCQLRLPAVRFNGVAVEPPPGAFLQASEAGQAAIVAAVLAGVPAKRQVKARIFDLYAGCGTISFTLAALAPVHAVEGDAASLAALRKSAGGGKVTAEQRDLARRPMMAAELKNASVVVLDPPHAGAAEQTAQIAASGVPTVIYVSCHPASLARDAAMLEGKYGVTAATPIDQFLWSARLESVVVFQARKDR